MGFCELSCALESPLVPAGDDSDGANGDFQSEAGWRGCCL